MFVLPALIPAQTGLTFKYGMEKGNSYYYKIKSSQSAVQKINGQESAISSDSKIVLRADITGLTEDQFTSEFYYSSLYSKTSSMAGEEIQTEKDYAGRKTEFRFNRNGRKIEKKDIGPNSPIPTLIPTSPIVEFPAKPLKQGDKWIVEDTENHNPKVTIKSKTEYTLAGPAEKESTPCIKITFTGKSQMEMKGESNGYEFNRSEENFFNGFLIYDPAKQITLEREDNTLFKTTITVKSLNITYSLAGSSKTNFLLFDKEIEDIINSSPQR